VASGNTPVMTAACIACTSRTAQPRKSGKPNTTPAALAAINGHASRRGQGARITSR
jgi:hypothetical protein